VKILGTLERQGMFAWYNEFSAKVRSDAAVLEMVATAADASTSGPLTGEMQAFLIEVTAMNANGDARVEARKNTADEYAALAGPRASKPLLGSAMNINGSMMTRAEFTRRWCVWRRRCSNEKQRALYEQYKNGGADGVGTGFG